MAETPDIKAIRRRRRWFALAGVEEKAMSGKGFVVPPGGGSILSMAPGRSAALMLVGRETADGTVNLSDRVSRMQATGSGHWGLLPTHATDFRPDPKFLGPGSSMLCGSDVIAAEVEEVIDLIVR
jgi:hypothetical protein